MKKCPYCAEEIQDDAVYCRFCNHDLIPPPPGSRPGAPGSQSTCANEPRYAPGDSYHENGSGTCSQQFLNNDPFASGPSGKSRGVAALLALFFGYFGIQYFYCGKIAAGVITIILSCISCGIWSMLMFVQGIVMFCMTNQEFERKFVSSTTTLPLF